MQKDILLSTKRVIDNARHVRINHEAIGRFCDSFSPHDFQPVGLGRKFDEWDLDKSLSLVCLFNCINFCFWAAKDEPKWTIMLSGEKLDGAEALFCALEDAIDRDGLLLGAPYLSRISREDLAEILKGNTEIPMLDERVECLHQAGQVLGREFGGDFLNVIAEADGSAPRLVDLFVQHFPSFDDHAYFDGQKVEFHKRAQLNADMIHFRMMQKTGRGLVGTDQLTAFADYKIPQILRRMGILEYDPRLAERINAQQELLSGCAEEIEIRAATVWAIEYLKEALQPRYPDISARFLDDYLWTISQTKSPNDSPYHRTRTIFY